MKIFLLPFLIALIPFISNAQSMPAIPAAPAKPNTWKENQLIQPAELAALIGDKKAKKPLIFNIGVVEDIEGATSFGASRETANVEKLKKKLETLPKSSFIVVYCGCCPFDKCPNIRPAFSLLNDLGFKNARLLNISKNIKTDWIDKGYPLAK